MVQMLQGYCLVSTGVRISCCNQAGKNCKKQQVLATSGNPNLRANILDVFGPKQVDSRDIELSVRPFSACIYINP